MRAQVVAHHVLHALEPWIESLERLQDADRGRNVRRDVYRALFDLFFAAGVEVISDADRAAAGLEPRNHDGLTDTELQIMEARLTEAMLRPVPPIFIKEKP